MMARNPREPNLPHVGAIERRRLDRREFLYYAAVTAAAAGPLGGLLGLSGCGERSTRDRRSRLVFEERYRAALQQAEAAGTAREVRIVAEPGEVEVGPGRIYRTWLYNGQFPGPEIRLREGERLRVTLENRLPDATTIHWHGVPVPNAMDGVPGVTQAPVPAGGRFVYDYVAEPAGSYIYHSHVGLQLDQGLVGPLVIEERTSHVAYDRDYVVVLDDLLLSEPTPASQRRGGMMGRGMMRGMRGRMGGERGMTEEGQERQMMIQDPARPDYDALLINGRTAADPPAFEVRRGERVRLRFVNLSSATTFRVAIAGHRMTVTHTDGRPVEPVTVDSFPIGMGERYDVVVEANNPGFWTLAAASVLGNPEPARAVLRYADARQTTPGPGDVPSGQAVGRTLRLRDLIALETPIGVSSEPDRTFKLTLSWGMMMAPDEWTIEGQKYPDAEPLEIGPRERIRVSMTNMSPIHHPMHLHGHFFRVGDALKETVLVPAHRGHVAFEFTADNPGDWFFHCHNLYHLEAGMARVFRYA